MTSNPYSFLNIVKSELKELRWAGALYSVLFFFVTILPTASEVNFYYQGHERIVDSYNLLSFAEMLSPSLWFSWIIGIATGCTILRYLHIQKQVDFYHSLPIKRETLFFAKVIAGFLIFVIPFLMTQVVSILIVAFSGMIELISVISYFKMVLWTLLGFLLFYSITILAGILTGRSILQLLLACYIAFFGMIWYLVYQITFARFFDTFVNTMYFDQSIEQLANVTPLIRLVAGTLYPQTAMTAVLWVLMIVFFFALSIFFYKKRRSEAAGRSIAFPFLEPILKYSVALFGGILVAEVLASTNNNLSVYVWYLIGLISGSIVVIGIANVIFRGDFKEVVYNKKSIAIFMVFLLLLFGVFYFDAFGYDRYTPSIDSLTSVRFNIRQIRDFYGDLNYNYEYDENNNNGGKVHNRFELTTEEDKKAIFALIDEMEENNKTIFPVEDEYAYKMDFDGYYVPGSDVKYDYINLEVRFEQDGDYTIRQYSGYVALHESEAIESLLEGRGVKDAATKLLRDDEILSHTFCLIGRNNLDQYYYDTLMNNVDEEFKEGLINAMIKDIENTTVDELKAEGAIPYILKISYAMDNDNEEDDVDYIHENIYIYQCYDETIAYIETYLKALVGSIPKELVDEIRVIVEPETYGDGVLVDPVPSTYTTDDPAMIEAILQHAQLMETEANFYYIDYLQGALEVYLKTHEDIDVDVRSFVIEYQHLPQEVLDYLSIQVESSLE